MGKAWAWLAALIVTVGLVGVGVVQQLELPPHTTGALVENVDCRLGASPAGTRWNPSYPTFAN